MAVSSFKKKATSKLGHPRGTRPSIHNSKLLVSTGVPSLDPLLGGGVAVGSVLLLEEDKYENYSQTLLKYFIAEGIELPDDDDSRTGKAFVPLLEEAEGDEDESTLTSQDPMKIAWRYQGLPKVDSSFSNQFGHSFDLTRRLSGERIDMVEKTLLDMTQRNDRSPRSLYSELKAAIQKAVDGMIEGGSTLKTVLRVAIHSLGSPLWGEDISNPGYELTQFLHSLRGLMRDSCSVALVTVPTHLFQDASFVRRLERLSDGVVRLESFVGSNKEHHPLYSDYHGLLHLVKIPRINSLTSPVPDTLDLAFKLRRRKFVIEKLHLPPELSETVSRTQEEPTTTRGHKTKQGLGNKTTTKTTSLDF